MSDRPEQDDDGLPDGFQGLPRITDPEARARDRGRDQLFGDNFPAGEDDPPPSLGDPNAVELLVRGFLGEAVAQRRRWNEGAVDGAEAAAALGRAAARHRDIVYGREPAAYAPLPGWNAPAGLGAALKDRNGWDCPDEQAAEVLFLTLARRLAEAMAEHESDAMPDEQAEFEVEAIVEDAVVDLLGLPRPRTE